MLPTALLLAACLPTASGPTPSATPNPPTPTATVAFPTLAPTATEDLPTQPPPPDPLADVGQPLFSATFSEDEGWQLGADAFGATSILDDMLSIVVTGPSVTRLVPSPAPIVDEFVLVASFRAELCRGTDEYGLAWRLRPSGDHLRFTLTCAGGLRLRRVISGASRALVPFVDHEPAVNAGAPARNQLIVRARGDEFLLYVNEVPVLKATAPPIPPGRIGLVVRSDGDSDQATIAVSEFILYDLKSSPTSTPDVLETPDG